MSKNTIVAIVAVLVFLFLFVTAQSNPRPTGINAIPENDREFLKWATSTSEIIKSHMLDIDRSGKSNDTKNMTIHGKLLRLNTEKFLNRSRQFNVSGSLKSPLDNIQKSYNYFNLAGKYIEIGANDSDVESLRTAMNYANQGGEYMADVAIYVQNYMERTN